MKNTLSQMIEIKYGINAISNKLYEEFKSAVLIAIDVEELDFEGAMMMRQKTIEVIAKTTGVKIEVLDCLTIQNIEDMFKESVDYYDIQKTLIDLIKLYNASVEVGAQLSYSVMSRKRWMEEVEYWEFEEDNKEEMEHLNTYKNIRDYGMFKYSCYEEIIL